MGCTLHQHGHSHGGGSSHSHGGQNINVRAAFIHVLGDFLQSIGVFIAALVIYFKVRYLPLGGGSVWVRGAGVWCGWVGEETAVTVYGLLTPGFGVVGLEKRQRWQYMVYELRGLV